MIDIEKEQQQQQHHRANKKRDDNKRDAIHNKALAFSIHSLKFL